MAKRALIIANSRYDDPHFTPLPAATADAAALAGVLGDPDIGGFAVETLIDGDQRSAQRALESLFTRAGPDDLLLLHLSLHGWKDLRGRLHFVMRDTERDLPGSTAVPADMVGDWIGQSRCRRIVVLLDCCYSGAFTVNARRRGGDPPAVDVAEPFAGNGRVVLTASTALQYAHEAERDVRSSRAPAEPSVFTSAVVDGLRDGSADLDGDGLVSVHELYTYVHDRVRRRVAAQTPTLSVDNAQGTIHIARNPRHGDAERLAELRNAVLGPEAWRRAGALHLVERLLGSVRGPNRDAARDALLTLTADADRDVAARARALWHGRGLGEIPAAPPPRRPRDKDRGRGRDTGPRPIVGIDFGTTNSAIGVVEGGDVRLIPNAEGAFTTPSVVAVTAEGDVLVGTAAQRQAVTNPEYTVRAAKLRLGTDWSVTRGGVRLTAQEVARLMLARLRADAEAALGGPLGGAVLTVPVGFGLDRRAALVRAGELAGLRVARVVSEPTAASMAYGLNREDCTVLIFDLGGGTLDVSLVEIGDGVAEVKAAAGDDHLGGDDWDLRIVRDLTDRVRRSHGVDLSGDVAAVQRLREAATTAKFELSAAHAASVRLPYLATGPRGPVHLDEVVTRAQFEDLTRDLLLRCRRPVEQALRDAGLAFADIDRVILTGGATRMPAIGELVRELTGGREPYRGLIPEGVATGAALQAGVLTGAVKEVLLLDACSASLGVGTRGGITVKLMQRNTVIPEKRRETFTTGADGQPVMLLRVVEGERAAAADNRTLAVLELALPPAPRGVPRVEVAMDVDANGVLHVAARDLGTGARVAATVDHATVEAAAARTASPGWSDRYAPVLLP
ncbi:caspase, EACC1-associated type [Streptomyces avicenniae]|uniref:caspase, EACC1-associated type n=1 Tax=Streptomyces avicenniae TaxID=500153 RepID=UPI00069BB248|nr:Hsp70 family protein [Streptomyces avicenniae]